MEIHIDGSVLSLQSSGGISKYISDLLPALGEVVSKVDRIELSIFPGCERNLLFREALPNITKHTNLAPSSRGGMMRRLTGFWPKERATLIHSPYFCLPIKTRARCILTLHDLIDINNTKSHRARLRRSLLFSAIRRADLIICVSEATRRDLHDLFPSMPSSKSKVVHHGVSPDFFTPGAALSPAITEFLDQLSGAPFVLYVGNRGGYKNFAYAIDGLAHSKRYESVKLVCVGGGSLKPEEMAHINRVGLSHRCHLLGSLAGRDLAFLYSRAFALLYPSIKEGFGMPILEAMASGCPVICSPHSSMGEVAGDAGIYLQSFECDELGRSLDSLVLGDVRAMAVARGKARSINFSWALAAQKTYEAYVS